MHRPRRLAGALAALLTVAVVGTATPAQAAVPDKFGFVFWDGAIVPTSTWPTATTVTVFPPNVVQVRFPGLAAPGGVVHVTAVNDAPRWCQAITWFPAGADEIVYVACYGTGGVPALTQFSAIFESSSGPATPGGSFGYVDVGSTGALVTQYNSAGAVNAAAALAPGVVDVKLPGLSTPGGIDGSIQVTAVNPAVPARCKVRNWTSSPFGQDAVVLCFDGTGAPLATRFTLTYQYQRSLYGAAFPPKYFGYLWSVPPLGPPSTNFNSVLGPAANNVIPGGSIGLYGAIFPKLAVLPDNVQVTAVGAGSDYCNIANHWSHSGGTTVAWPACYTNAGARDPSGFTISANSAF